MDSLPAEPQGKPSIQTDPLPTEPVKKLFTRWIFTNQEFLDFDPMDHSLAGSSVLGILPARILDWVGVSASASVLSMNIQD